MVCSNMISEASVVQPKSRHLDMRIEKEHLAPRAFIVGGQLPYPPKVGFVENHRA